MPKWFYAIPTIIMKMGTVNARQNYAIACSTVPRQNAFRRRISFFNRSSLTSDIQSCKSNAPFHQMLLWLEALTVTNKFPLICVKNCACTQLYFSRSAHCHAMWQNHMKCTWKLGSSDRPIRIACNVQSESMLLEMTKWIICIYAGGDGLLYEWKS